ncbi:WD40 repeat-like protein [Imleria badia]|nr:WD40 repeat-like protein [Imleria badia]
MAGEQQDDEDDDGGVGLGKQAVAQAPTHRRCACEGRHSTDKSHPLPPDSCLFRGIPSIWGTVGTDKSEWQHNLNPLDVMSPLTRTAAATIVESEPADESNLKFRPSSIESPPCQRPRLTPAAPSVLARRGPRQWSFGYSQKWRGTYRGYTGGIAARCTDVFWVMMARQSDGNWIVTGGWCAVTLFNRRTRQIAFASAPDRDHRNSVNDVHVSPDSTKFATASYDSTAIIWSISNGRPLFPPLRHSGYVSSVRFSPDGNRIATAVYRGEVRIHNANNGQLLSNIAVISLPYISRAIAWSSSQHIYVLCAVNVLRHIFVDTGTILSEWSNLGQPECHHHASIALSNNGRFIASFIARSLAFWDTSTCAQVGPVLDLTQNLLQAFALSADNNYIATGYGGTITLHNLADIIPTSNLVGGSVVPQAQLTPQRIPDGKYRIKSNTGDLCLTRTGPQGGANTISVRPLSQSDDQKWTCTFVTANGAYKITSNANTSLTVGIRNALVTGGRGTTWTFESRGDAYVIGNAVNASAIQLASDRQSVSVFPRDNCANQRWVLIPI